MSGLLGTLLNAGNSLGAHTAAQATTAHNLANANTPGYARQRAELAATYPPALSAANGTVGAGVSLSGVTQARSRFLDAQVTLATASQRQSSTQVEMLQAVVALDPQAGLTEALSHFYASLRGLTQNAGSRSVREAAVGSAGRLVQAFHLAVGNVSRARDAADAQLGARLPEVNNQLAQVARLNEQIRGARVTGGNPNDLLDQRQALVESLAAAVGARTVPSADGDANLFLPDGTALVMGVAAGSLGTIASPANGMHLSLQLTAVDGTGPRTLVNLPGGELGGILRARDAELGGVEARLDTLAFELASALNAVHQSGYGLDGTTGRALFTLPATSLGAARELQLNAEVAADVGLFAAAQSSPVAPGDARAAQAMVDTESQLLSTGATAGNTLSGLTSSFGAAVERLQAQLDGETSVLDHVKSMRDAVSGVSIDEELVAMQRTQRAYQAVSKVIQTTDQLLETLLNLR